MEHNTQPVYDYWKITITILYHRFKLNPSLIWIILERVLNNRILEYLNDNTGFAEVDPLTGDFVVYAMQVWGNQPGVGEDSCPLKSPTRSTLSGNGPTGMIGRQKGKVIHQNKIQNYAKEQQVI